MSCWTIVTKDTNIKATKDEMKMALEAMQHKAVSVTDLNITLDNGMVFSRLSVKDAWVYRMGTKIVTFDAKQLQHHVVRAKILLEAKRVGYPLNSEQMQGDDRVIRVRIQ